MSGSVNKKAMPIGKDSKQIKCTVKETRKFHYEEAASRANLMSLGAWLFQAAEEKLQRDCPDLYKQK